MILHGKINNCKPLVMDDGKTIYQTTFTDASRPLALRTSGEFTTYLNEDVRKSLPSGDDIDGQEISVLVREFKPGKSGGMSVKGQIVKGLVQPSKWGEIGELPTRPVTAAK